MMNLNVSYLLESSVCLILFMTVYKLLISNFTHFAWMRFYVLISLVLSLVLPFIIIPVQWHSELISTESLSHALSMPVKQTETNVVAGNPNPIQVNSEISILLIIFYGVFVVYLTGVIYKSYLFVKGLINIYGFIKKSLKVKEENYWIVRLKNEMPAFSFFNYIFINNNYKNLSSHELQIIKNHEIVHVKQYHTFDILFVELVSILFWFNPVMNYLRKSLKEIHEYIVDEKIAGHGENKKVYAQLLLTLASDIKVFNLATSFAGEHIKRRILMMAKPRTSPKYKLMFSILVPLTAMLLVSFSCVKNPDPKSLNTGKINMTDKAFWTIQWELQKYCGVYLPSEKNAFLSPLSIQLKDNKLVRVIETSGNEWEVARYKKTDPKPQDRIIELQFEAGHKFSYGYNNVFKIEFIVDSKNEVTGCFFTQREGLGFGTYELTKKK